MGERPEAEDRGGATWWHSRVRYHFARRGADGKRVLDLACGNGFGTMLLADRAASAVGADVSEAAVASARRANSSPKVRFELVREPPFPFEDASFDLIVCLETLEHVRQERQPAFVAELVRVLAPGGVLVLSTPDREIERAYDLATGAANPFHLHTPTDRERDELLAALPHRLELAQVDLITTVLGRIPVADGRASNVTAMWGAGDPPAPIARLVVCARSPDALAPFRDVAMPIAFRDEPRLPPLDHLLDARPVRLRWHAGMHEQIARLTRHPGVGPIAGTSRWWKLRAAYELAASRAAGARVLDAACGAGFGAALLGRTAREVVGLAATAEEADHARRLNGGANVRFEHDAARIGDGPFDLVIAAGPDAGEWRDRVTPSGSIVLVDLDASSGEGDSARSHSLPGFALVATTVLPVADSDPGRTLATAEVVAFPDATPSFRVLLAGGEPVPAQAVLCVRGDFQRQALVTELLSMERIHDLSALPGDEQIAVLSMRLARAEAELARIARASWLLRLATGVRRRLSRLVPPGP